MKKVKISASIICADWLNMGKSLTELTAEGIDYIHYDIMDGFFAPTYTIGTDIIRQIRDNTQIPSDFHLMVEEPARIFQRFTPKAEDIFSIHYEACRNLHRDLMAIRSFGCKTGVVLNPATNLEALDYIIDDVDIITIMTVNPGYTGQKLVPQTIQKIKRLKDKIDTSGLNIELEVDGNVNAENIPKMVGAGADILVGGSSGLFIKDMSLTESVARMKTYIDEGLKLRGQNG
ncbi:MAG: ribulose-phosphate 3-epimerase [Candidatus Margulisbacteria bacterium]|nr:ribulose-phosphate 3-epimerase [Candidatus Margulisiibacteriota bacterium]MBU1617136.1 ribulose-phosphate 3-epimerase [Candidatus Margulisiibacteriota bacterium]